jgi:MFS family permease
MQLITLLLVSTMTVMAGATISPALPQIEAFFGEVPNAAFWVKLMLTMPALFTAISAPLVGIVIDRFGRKPLLVAATVLYGTAGGSGLVLNSLSELLMGRALLGVAVAAIMTTATALIADCYLGPRREQVMGLQAAFVGYGGVLFLIVGGLLADIGWRFPFAIYLIAFGICALVVLFITEPQRSREEAILPIESEPLAKPPQLPTPAHCCHLRHDVCFDGGVLFSAGTVAVLSQGTGRGEQFSSGASDRQPDISQCDRLDELSSRQSPPDLWRRHGAGIPVYGCGLWRDCDRSDLSHSSHRATAGRHWFGPTHA